MIRAFAVCAAFTPALVLPAQAFPTNPTKAERDLRAASNYRTIRHSFTDGAKFSANILNSRYCVDKKPKRDCETQEILLNNPMPAGVANEAMRLVASARI